MLTDSAASLTGEITTANICGAICEIATVSRDYDGVIPQSTATMDQICR